MRATYHYTYAIRSGQHRQHDEWVQTRGRSFWRDQQGFANFQMYYTLIGPGPDVVTLVEFESAEQITRALAHPEAMTLWEEFSSMVDELETKVLVPTTEVHGGLTRGGR